MLIRPVEKRDIPRIYELLGQILRLHAELRPDIFRADREKYDAVELEALLTRPDRPSFVAEEDSVCVGYALCEIRQPAAPQMLPRKALYLDDLCVDSAFRGRGIGRALVAFIREYAAEIGADALELNVWEANADAKAFYEKLGFKTQCRHMELKL